MADEEVSIPIPSLLSLPLALQARVLQHAFTGLSSGGILEYPHIEGVMTLMQGAGGSKRVTLPGGYWAMRSYDTLLMGKEGESPQGMAGELDLLIPGRTRLDKLGVELEATIAEGNQDPQADPPANPDTAFLDYHRLAFPLRVRTFRFGDSFIPLGMKGRKKLKNFFIDLKIPRAERLKIPLVISGNDICWVAGLRIDERFKILPDTGKTLKFRLMRL
jgi:tRNA(Ile)-lysidine synthase